MLKKITAAILFAAFVFAGVEPAEAYDLPKFKIEKPKKADKKNPPKVGKKETKPTPATLYMQKIEKIAKSGEVLPPDSPERVYIDKNFIFVGFYKNTAFFLDKFSLLIHKDAANERGWEQKLFSMGEKITPKNSKALNQNFYTDGEKIYNAKRAVTEISGAKTEEDRIFLEECFKIGYFFTFGENAPENLK